MPQSVTFSIITLIIVVLQICICGGVYRVFKRPAADVAADAALDYLEGDETEPGKQHPLEKAGIEMTSQMNPLGVRDRGHTLVESAPEEEEGEDSNGVDGGTVTAESGDDGATSEMHANPLSGVIENRLRSSSFSMEIDNNDDGSMH